MVTSLHLLQTLNKKKDETCFISQLIVFRSSYQMVEVEVEVEVESEIQEATRVEKVVVAQSPGW